MALREEQGPGLMHYLSESPHVCIAPINQTDHIVTGGTSVRYRTPCSPTVFEK